MNRTLAFTFVAVFSIFLGSQITEGCLFVPYWQRLSKTAFYEYYSIFGPAINNFYTSLTIVAVLIPVCSSIYCYYKKSPALKYALVSTFFACSVIIIFYLYFKDVNQQFYAAAFDTNQLKSVLSDWERWHWLRVVLELGALIFLIMTQHVLIKNSKA
ncbi:MAG: hypothetical protein AAF849_18090 [Bacteroidota bacterium]